MDAARRRLSRLPPDFRDELRGTKRASRPRASRGYRGTHPGLVFLIALCRTQPRKVDMAKSEAPVEELVGMIQRGELRLPEMQRQYVWRSTRVRDLLDSLYRG